MTFPLARLVDAPAADATVRYDFNDADALAGRVTHADGFTLGAPSLLSAPDSVSPMYGDRGLSFRHEIGGAKSDALAALAVLSRELLRPSSWFMFQADAFTRPTFWRLRATGPEALSFDRVFTDPASGDPVNQPDAWEIPISLTAEAFGYGERITLGPYTVVQDATGTNPMRVVLPTIHGDAPTALRVAVTPSEDILGSADSEWLIGCLSGDSELAVQYLNIGTGDGLTPVTGTGAGASNAAYIGGSYRPITVTPDEVNPGDNFAVRLVGSFDGDLRGRYKVLLRVEADSAADVTTYLFRLGATGAIATWDVGGDGLTNTTAQGWVDLGEATYPPSLDIPLDAPGTPGPTSIYLMAGTAGNVDGAIRADALLFLPVDGPHVSRTELLGSKFHPLIDPLDTAYWDGDLEAAWLTTDAGVFKENCAPVLTGGFPTADPAAETNLLLVAATALRSLIVDDATGCLTSIDAEMDVTVSYHPRLLHLDGRP